MVSHKPELQQAARSFIEGQSRTFDKVGDYEFTVWNFLDRVPTNDHPYENSVSECTQVGIGGDTEIERQGVGTRVVELDDFIGGIAVARGVHTTPDEVHALARIIDERLQMTNKSAERVL